MSAANLSLPPDPDSQTAESKCGCGLTPPTTFPRDPALGDRCPIGPMQMHHWHDADCVFCSRFREAG